LSEVIILSATRNRNPVQTQPTHRTLGAALALLAVAPPFAATQTPRTTSPPADVVATKLSLRLPDSPGFLASSSRCTTDTPAVPDDLDDLDDLNAPQTTPGISATPPNTRTKHSAHFAMTVAPGEMAQPMSVQEKVVGGLKNSVSLISATGWIASAGWTQLTNGSPNYGTDKGAFGQRLGATALRNISEGIFSRSFFAPVFHEDPRYYIMGKGNNLFKRVIYAATRTVVTRTDDGRSTPNFALLAGNAAGAALTVTYYPAQNTTFSEAAETFGTSVGGSAVGFVVREFIDDALEYAHLKKRD
jgi:hypothetical protein